MNNLYLSENSYGKSGVEIFVCASDDEWLQIVASIKIEGSFDGVFREGVNLQILPTDTFSNHFEDLASSTQSPDIYKIGVAVLERLMDCMEDATLGTILLSATRWRKLADGLNSMVADPTSLEASIKREANGKIEITGSAKRRVIRPSGSSFAGFRRDHLTDKEDVESRILYGDLVASWRYSSRPNDLFEAGLEIADQLVGAFGNVSSGSLQENIYKAAATMLSVRSDVDEFAICFDSFAVQNIAPKSNESSEDSHLWRSVPRPVGTTYAKVVREV
jgi:urate oxidase